MRAWPEKYGYSLILAHGLLLALVIAVLLPGAKATQSPASLLAAIALMELAYLFRLSRRARQGQSCKAPSDIICAVWLFLLVWEVLCTKLALTHPVLIPPAENVFYVFPSQWQTLLVNVASSLELLLIGVVLGVGGGVLAGVAVGWLPRLREAVTPIARVLAPIPPVVYSPYLIALAPSFRLASGLIILLGVFFPTLLNTILRVNAMEPRLLESARSLALSDRTMLGRVLLPYVLPGVISSLKVTLATSVLLLVFAEMMGATSGLGYYIINYNTYANYANVAAGVIMVGLVVTALVRLVDILEKKALPWL